MKRIAIVGGGKEGLALLPMLKKAQDARVVLIAERNPDALIFKLGELGYRISGDLGINITSDLNIIKDSDDIDLIIDASDDVETHALLHSGNLEKRELISPLSARLIWGHMEEGADREAKVPKSDKAGLLSSLREIVDAVNLTNDKVELLSMVLRVALSSSGAERGSIMLLKKEDGPLTIEVSEGVDEDIVRKFKGRPGEGIAGRVARSGKPLLLSGRVDDSVLDELRSKESVKSALSVPLLAEKRTIGVLNVSTDRSTDAFGESDLKYLTDLAAVGARIILRSQEIEEMRDNSGRFDAWKSVANIMNASMTLGKKLWEVSRILSAHTGGECSIFTVDRDSAELHLKASSGKSFSPSIFYKVALGEGVEGVAAESENEVTMEGEKGDGKMLIKAYPLVSGGELQGVLKMFYSYIDEVQLKNEMLTDELISLISEEIRSSFKEERMTLKATKVSAINEAGINLISTNDIKDLSRLAVSSASMILDAEAVVLRLLSLDTSHFTIMAAHGADDKESRLSLFGLDKKIAHDVINKGETLLISDIGKSKYSDKTNTVSSCLSHPLKKKGKVIGTLSLYDKFTKDSFKPVPFNREDGEIVERFTSYLEKAVSNIFELEESRKLIMLDELTSLPNAESMERRLKDEVERARRYKRTFSFTLLEIVNFNSYVRVYGHDGGERLVRDVAGWIRDSIRAFDILGRFWGSRFGVIFPESEERGEDIVKRLTERIEGECVDPEELFAPQEVKVAAGFVKYSGGDVEGEELVKKAAEDLEKKRRTILASLGQP